MIKLNILKLFTILGILIIFQSIQLSAQDEPPPSLTANVYGKVYNFEGSPSKGAVIEITTPQGLWESKTNNEGLYYNSEILIYSGNKLTVKVTNADKTESGTESHIVTDQEYIDRQIGIPDITLSPTESKSSESIEPKEINTKNESSVSTENIKSDDASPTSNQTLSKEESAEVKTSENIDQSNKPNDSSNNVKEKEPTISQEKTQEKTEDISHSNNGDNNLWWLLILILIVISIGALFIWKKRNE